MRGGRRAVPALWTTAPTSSARDRPLVENGDVPLLAVEVRSPSTAGRDASFKRRAYARLGIASYWLLDVDTPSLGCWSSTARVPQPTTARWPTARRPVVVQRPFPITVVPARLLEV